MVLSRKEAERIRLGDSIVVTIIRIGGDKVRLGIEAPDDVLVLRDELEPHELAALSAINQSDQGSEPTPEVPPAAGEEGQPSESDAA